jgi:hypothetical protein
MNIGAGSIMNTGYRLIKRKQTRSEEPDSAGAAERCGRLLLELEQALLILPTQRQREAGGHQHL